MIKLLKYLKNYKLQSILGPLFKLTEACFELIVPLIMAKIIDVGIAEKDKSYIFYMGIILILLGIMGLVCSLTAQYFAAKASLGFGTELRRDLFHHINTFTHNEIDKFGSSTLVTRMTVDINQVQSGVNMLLRLFLRSPFIVIGAVIMAFTISAKLTAVFLAASVVLGAVIYIVMRSTMPMFKKIQKGLDKITLSVSENLSGVRVIRAFSKQKDEEKLFDENTHKLRNMQITAGRISALTNPCTYVLVYTAIILIIWFGGIDVNAGVLTQGELIALISYMNQILLALLAVAVLVTSLTKAQASSIRINDIFVVSPSFTDVGNKEIDYKNNVPAIEFDNVTFCYGESDEPALKNISFSVMSGETVGIIGGTGSGKTTLVSLIPRFYEKNKGSIKVFGTDVSDYPFEQLRGMIGYVPQKAELFRGTIKENMSYRKKDVTDKEIWSVLEIAQATEFVKDKTDELDYLILSGGKNLSGGQRQRLTIARALIGDPKIIIMDDSASALDMATDAALRHALAEKKKDMIMITVSQRVSSIRNADKIIVLDDGIIAGIGTHEQLIKTSEIYKEICISQQYDISGEE